MTILLGPILSFRGSDAATWRLSALFASDAGQPPPLQVSSGTVAQPVLLYSHGTTTVWRFDLAVPRSAQEQTVSYGLAGGATDSFAVPASGKAPRSAYASCNGFSDPKLMKTVAVKNERWTHLAQRHGSQPYHLLLLGGDQIYGDEIWSKQVPTVNRWCELPLSQRIKAKFSAGMQQQVEAFYFSLYLTRWSQAEPAAVLASIPSLMMWDDHDIFDGWGSHSDDENACGVFAGIFAAARTMFSVFQRQVAPGTAAPGQLSGQPGFTWGHAFENMAIVAPDLRSERSNDQIMGSLSWNALVGWLDALPAGLGHLLLLSSIPVVYADLTAIEKFLGILPGEQELEDDLRDHWGSPPHKGERLRLIHRLLLFARTKRVRVTILSGDVHVAALGLIESSRDQNSPPNANVINQLTSSAIVHPPPPGSVRWAIENLMSGTQEPDRGIQTRLLELPGAAHKIIGARNWLALEPDSSGRIWANWHVEGAKAPFTKVIHPVG